MYKSAEFNIHFLEEHYIYIIVSQKGIQKCLCGIQFHSIHVERYCCPCVYHCYCFVCLVRLGLRLRLESDLVALSLLNFERSRNLSLACSDIALNASASGGCCLFIFLSLFLSFDLLLRSCLTVVGSAVSGSADFLGDSTGGVVSLFWSFVLLADCVRSTVLLITFVSIGVSVLSRVVACDFGNAGKSIRSAGFGGSNAFLLERFVLPFTDRAAE